MHIQDSRQFGPTYQSSGSPAKTEEDGAQDQSGIDLGRISWCPPFWCYKRQSWPQPAAGILWFLGRRAEPTKLILLGLYLLKVCD